MQLAEQQAVSNKNEAYASQVLETAHTEEVISALVEERHEHTLLMLEACGDCV